MKFIERISEVSVNGSYPGARKTEDIISNGFLILDKWQGPTSHDVAATVRKILGVQKAGHSGTLDPQVSGVLPILLGKATKAMPALQRLDKEYVGVMHVHTDIGEDELRKAMITGKITQTPPRRSAVARVQRQRTVHSFEILDIEGRDVAFSVRCDAGTYIRVLCHDIGKRIGGGHMKELRRTAVGPFTERRAVKTQQIVDALGKEEIRELIFPVEAAMEAVKKVFMRDAALKSVSHGMPLYAAGITRSQDSIERDDMVCMFSGRGEAVALGKAMMSGAEMARKPGMAVKTDRVLNVFE